MAAGPAAPEVDDWKDVSPSSSEGDWKDVPATPPTPEQTPLSQKPIFGHPGGAIARHSELLHKDAPNLTSEAIGNANKSAVEGAVTTGAMALAPEILPELPGVGPAARFVAENVMPAVERIPYAGRAIQLAEEAPSMIKAAVRGASTGAGTGALEEGIRTRSLSGAGHGALIGAGTGALAGAGAYGIGKLAYPALDATGENIPYAGEKTPPVTEGPSVSRGTQSPSIPKRVDAAVRTMPGNEPLQTNVPLRAQPSAGQTVSDVVNKNVETEAVRPLASDVAPQKGKSLQEITRQGPPEEPVAHRATVTHEGKTIGMEATNGRKMYEATANDTALAKQVHDLRNNDVTNAYVNLGGDMNKVGQEGQRFKVGESNRNQRRAQFDWMLDQGHSPQDIIKAAGRAPGA